MKRKTTTTDLKKEIRKRFESGEDLIDLALSYKISYGTLRNISSSEKWQKGIIKDLIYLKELELETEKKAKEKLKRKKEYKSLTKALRRDLKNLSDLPSEEYSTSEEDNKSIAETKATVIKLRTSALKEVWSIDKELHQIRNDTEEQDLITKRLKYEELKRKAGLIDDKNSKDLIID